MFYYHKGLTRAARRTVATAITIAGRQGCTAVDTGHLLLAMLQTGRGTAVEFLRRKQITVTALSACASQRACTGRPLHLRGRDLAPESRKALEFAVLGAHAARVNKAENEHLLCAMLEDTACTASVWLAGLGLEVPRAARECRQLSGQLVLPSSPRMSSTRGSRPSEKYGRDLTRLAQEGQLDPVLCRDDELERMIEILCRRQKNNPCLLGEPGVGKSALAEALAQRIAAGQVTPSLKGKRVLALDMASMVAGTKYRGDFEERFKNLLEELYRDRSTILFIDEIHRLHPAIEEYLYPAMEDFRLDIIIDQGPNARSIQLNLPKFTLVGATTRAGMLTSPLRSRFGLVNRLDYYTREELCAIIERSAGLLNVPVDPEGALQIALRSRGTPRVANSLLRWVRDYAQVRGDGVITEQLAHDALTMIEIDDDGLDEMDKRLLEAMIYKFNGGPVGLSSLAVAVGEDASTLEDVHEPFLIMQGYISRTPRGRVAMPSAYLKMGAAPPANGQGWLL